MVIEHLYEDIPPKPKVKKIPKIKGISRIVRKRPKNRNGSPTGKDKGAIYVPTHLIGKRILIIEDI